MDPKQLLHADLPKLQMGLAQKTVQRLSAGGNLSVEVNLLKTITEIRISPECLTRTDASTLAAELKRLLNDALAEAEKRAAAELMSLSKSMMPLPR